MTFLHARQSGVGQGPLRPVFSSTSRNAVHIASRLTAAEYLNQLAELPTDSQETPLRCSA